MAPAVAGAEGYLIAEVSDWLVVLSEDNWSIRAREGLIGLGRRAEAKLASLSEGDRLWIYINKRHLDRQTPWVRRIRAIVTIGSQGRTLERPPGKSLPGEAFPFARPIRVDRSIDLPRDLLKRLSFVKDEKAWGIYLLNAPLKLTRADVRKLESAAGMPARPLWS